MITHNTHKHTTKTPNTTNNHNTTTQTTTTNKQQTNEPTKKTQKEDERFLVKTTRKSEMKVLLAMLPAYYAHMAAHPGSLLTRFFGVHRVSPASGRKVRFVVMSNIFVTDLLIHRRYDIKGSSHGRTAGVDPRQGVCVCVCGVCVVWGVRAGAPPSSLPTHT
jgi:hypothetical protein